MDIRRIVLCLAIVTLAAVETACSRNISDQTGKSYEGLSHGFGIGTGTVAEGWIRDAVKFWNSANK